MVFSLGSALQKTERFVGVAGSGRHRFEESAALTEMNTSK